MCGKGRAAAVRDEPQQLTPARDHAALTATATKLLPAAMRELIVVQPALQCPSGSTPAQQPVSLPRLKCPLLTEHRSKMLKGQFSLGGWVRVGCRGQEGHSQV